MKQLTCEVCGSTDLIKQDGVFVCQACGCKYSVEDARKMMIEGAVSIEGAVKTKSDDFEVRAGELIAYHGVETNVIIPDGIKIIGAKCFADMQAIESVIIPEGVYKIKTDAFSGCSGLKNVIFPKSLSIIESCAFCSCETLTEIEFPCGGTEVMLGDACFHSCSSLKSIKLPASVNTGKARGCFSFCTSLETIQLSDGIQMLGESCFSSCTSLKSIQLPDGIQALGDECFAYCTSLKSIQLPDSIQKIGNACFYNCTSLKSVQLPTLARPYLYDLYTSTFGNTPWALEKQKKNSGCYIATAVYGSYDCPQVWTLRRYRDATLAKTWYGRTFICVYYAISPTLVKWFGHTEWFKRMWKGKLDRMVSNLQANGVESTPYKDKPW